MLSGEGLADFFSSQSKTKQSPLNVELERDPTHEQHDGCGVEEGARGADGGFEVLRQPPIAPDPGKEPLDDPAPWVYSEADLTGVLVQTSPQRTTKFPIAIRKATPVIAEVRNTSLNVTAHVLVWPVS
jgi:hypothetical protein